MRVTIADARGMRIAVVGVVRVGISILARSMRVSLLTGSVRIAALVVRVGGESKSDKQQEHAK